VGGPGGHRGGRIYFDLTTPKYIPHHWYRVFAVWDGGLGIWGGIALAARWSGPGGCTGPGPA
jgi:prolipoprotein diacylglyceryltransferase